MLQQLKNIAYYSVTVFTVTLFFSCESNFKEIQKINYTEFMPSGEADSVNLKYTDSGRITAVLTSPKMLDFNSIKYPFTEFPKGMDVILFDKNGSQNKIRADYAVTFKGTDIIDLKGNVKMTSNGGQFLETEQLYYDQKNQWFYTEKKFKFTDPNKGVSTGEGIDFSKDFTRINFQKVYGEIDNAN
jgi:LPS export ABC transporter protein LptC